MSSPRSAARGWQTPVILITAFGDEATHREARDLGAVRVLDKPFALDSLVALVRRIAPRWKMPSTRGQRPGVAKGRPHW